MRMPSLNLAGANRSFVLRCAVLMLIGVTASSCGRPTEPKATPWEGFNIVWISFDSVRADHCSVNGYHRDTTPVLGDLGEEGINFSNCVAQAPYTLPSYSSMLTSHYVAELSVRARENRSGENVVSSSGPALESENTLLSEVLASHGYATAAFVQSWLSRGFGFDQGWDSFNHRQRSVEENVTDAVEWMEKNRDQPFFVFLYGTDTHYPFRRQIDGVGRYGGHDDGFNITLKTLQAFRRGELTLGPKELDNAMALYDEGLHKADQDLKPLFDFLTQSELSEKTIVVFNSDHGEEFSEHGVISHGQTYFNEVIKTPLIFYATGIPARGDSIDALVENIDVAPTLLDMVGLPVHETFRGQSLVPFLLEPGFQRDGQKWAFSEGAWTLWVGSVLRDNDKLIYVNPDRKMLYDIGVDPREEQDRALADPDISRDLEGALLEHLGISQASLQALVGGQDRDYKSWMEQVMEQHKERLDSATLEQLKALGYVE